MQQGELSVVCVGLSERDLKNFGGPQGGTGKIWGGSGPPGTPLVPPLIRNQSKHLKQRGITKNSGIKGVSSGLKIQTIFSAFGACSRGQVVVLYWALRSLS